MVTIRLKREYFLKVDITKNVGSEESLDRSRKGIPADWFYSDSCESSA